MNKTLPNVRVALLLLLLTAIAPPSPAQTYASGRQLPARTVSAPGEARRLRDVLQSLKEHYRVDILFEGGLVDQLTVGPLDLDFSQPVERNLNRVLQATNLRFRRVKMGTYLILAETRSRKKDVSQVLPADVPLSPEPAQPQPMLTRLGMFPPVTQTDKVADQTITGTVSDETGQGLPGVTVAIKGTQRGTVTDARGTFSLAVADKAAVLVFSFVGYEPQEVAVGDRTSLTVSLKADVKALSEVIVVGYGTQKKADLTGSVATVDIQQVLTKPAADVSNMLQGRVAGVVASGSNQPGGEGFIRIRGISSFGSNNPLIIIDGVQTGSTNSLNPNDIESMTILKDASSAAIYGARGAGGVIIITTKRGKANTTRISYDGFYGVAQVTRYPDLLNTPELGDLIWKQQQGAGLTPSSTQFGRGTSPVIPDYVLAGSAGGLFEGNAAVDPSRYNYTQSGFYQIARANKAGTDWFREMTQAAPVQSHNLSASGGTDKSVYSLSLGYYSEAGLQKYTRFDRYSLRANSEFKLGSRIRFGETLFGSFRKRNGSTDNDEAAPWSMAYRMQPIVPVYDIAGNFAGSKAPGTGNGQNPVAILYRNRNNAENDIRLLGSVYAEVDVLKGLRFRTNFGIDYNNSYRNVFTDINPEHSEGGFNTSLALRSNYQYRWTFTNTLSYDKTMGRHSLKGLAGIEAVDYKFEQLSGDRVGYYPFTDESFRVLDRGNTVGQSNSSQISVESLYSIFGRVDYAYDDKYLLNATLRRDGSSKFARDVRYGNFPSVSVGWRLSQEPFMRSLSFLTDLKVRAGYGVVGNDQIDANNQFTFYRSDPQRSFYDLTSGNTTTQPGYDLDRKGNSGSKWESTATLNLGLDLALFRSALVLNVDVYQKKTSDLLVQIPRPGTEGDFSAPFINIGNTENNGVDLMLTYRGRAGKLQYGVSGNFSAYRNRVVSPGVDFFTNTVRYGQVSRTLSGEAIGQFYGYVIDGFFNTVAEVQAAPTQAGVNKTTEATARQSVGRWRYKDIDGNGIINANDRAFIGSPHPKFQMGYNLDASYRNFDLNLFFFWNYGNQIYNNTKWWTDMNGAFAGNRSRKMLYDSWTPENTNASLPKLDVNDNITSSVPNSYYVESGSYFRAKTAQLGYTLPESLIKSLHISRCRVYVQAQNLFTITKYTGPDPDLLDVGRGDIGLGVDHGRVPNPLQVLGGLNLTF
ncbi:SusC/RagA family TonB-linked outer membrane protein [Spirosoma fluviale]|uniref:TonB-linked outer membrane protein, SusC/RagA family n=1 Tax=Spirosoma fluviale TaxID=1597977 RepID=A0A286GS93_9BACT|nr:TonB-dependent receptor [Spirosoma fluviale]SOD98403.1 TonB-linked outer membrane protein, SusC/RagA family [Spirosoma fluviale]